MSSYQCRKSHCGDKTVARWSYLHNGNSYTGKMSYLYWIGAQIIPSVDYVVHYQKLSWNLIVWICECLSPQKNTLEFHQSSTILFKLENSAAIRWWVFSEMLTIHTLWLAQEGKVLSVYYEFKVWLMLSVNPYFTAFIIALCLTVL